VRSRIPRRPSTSALRLNRSDDGANDGERYLVAIDSARSRLGALAAAFLFHPSIGSTNDVALDRATAAGDARDVEGLVVVADAQTSGRGRRGHAWFSPPRSGLYVSVVLAPARAALEPMHATSLLTLSAGVAIAEGIAVATGLHPALKWPNDVFVGQRKLAGILAEAAPHQFVVVGYGINVAASAFPPELREQATSLELELGREIDRAHLLVETLAALSRRYDDLLAGRFDAILDAWRALAPGAVGARVTWTTHAGANMGVTAGIDDHGALLVRVADRVERIVGGAVVWL
jgi:BirA family transcriptional regulator, biotin operon repressor / biotin---[acetyl-CoA-carboxylase] ligase